MAKAMLVINMPDSCLNCKLGQFSYVCGATLGEIIGYVDARPTWCPLKPMPKKSDYLPKDDHAYSKAEILAYTYGITVGRNEVIDEIMGETE